MNDLESGVGGHRKGLIKVNGISKTNLAFQTEEKWSSTSFYSIKRGWFSRLWYGSLPKGFWRSQYSKATSIFSFRSLRFPSFNTNYQNHYRTLSTCPSCHIIYYHITKCIKQRRPKKCYIFESQVQTSEKSEKSLVAMNLEYTQMSIWAKYWHICRSTAKYYNCNP